MAFGGDRRQPRQTADHDLHGACRRWAIRRRSALGPVSPTSCVAASNMTYIVHEQRRSTGLTKGQFSGHRRQGFNQQEGCRPIPEGGRSIWSRLAILMGRHPWVGRFVSSGRQAPAGAAESRRRWTTRVPPSSTSSSPWPWPSTTIPARPRATDYVREHNRGDEPQSTSSRPARRSPTSYAPRQRFRTVQQQHDGSILRLRKLGEGVRPLRQDRGEMKRVQGGPGGGRGS